MFHDLLRPVILKTLCGRAGMRPEKSSGQNFLINRATLDRIVAAVDPSPGDTILEIGAGFGVLTLALAERGAHVVAIERDRHIIPILRELVLPHGNVEVVEGDALRWLRGDHALPVIASEAKQSRRLFAMNGIAEPVPSRTRGLARAAPRDDSGKGWKLAANLPYGITSDFLRLLFDRIADGALPIPDRVVLLLQREVVDRLTADPKRASDRGAVGVLTMLTQLHSTPRRIARVPPGHFWPAPKVESAVVVLEHWRTPEEIAALFCGAPPPHAPPPGGRGRNEREGLLYLVHAAFARRRGQLSGILQRHTNRSREDIERMLGTLHIAPTARPETLSIEEWIGIAQAL